ncbi:MAG: NADH-quinone oxidoreductase subunit C [Candidatus Tectomicrobia bacterium]|nr:NADH-quinone oxidoreductase subunit C [Candidatus Tectomicrobia bacterium]
MPDEAQSNGQEEGSAPAAAQAPPAQDLRELVEREYAGTILEQSAYKDMADEATLVVRLDALPQVGSLLRDHPSARFRLLSDLTAAHFPAEERPFHVVYHLYSFDHNRRLRLKVKAHEGEQVPSVVSVWSGANWMEREVFDLFGVSFKGHPDLRRILLPEDWGSHPLRKDYPLEGRGERVYTKPRRKEYGE